jgi:hypothetical protein
MKDRDKKFLGKPTYRITWEDCRIADTICAIEMKAFQCRKTAQSSLSF